MRHRYARYRLLPGFPFDNSRPDPKRVPCDVLRYYSGKEPTLTRDGAWHRLAGVLYDTPGAKLFQDMEDALPLLRERPNSSL
jgi:hypothetical protein